MTIRMISIDPIFDIFRSPYLSNSLISISYRTYEMVFILFHRATVIVGLIVPSKVTINKHHKLLKLLNKQIHVCGKVL
jgi:hypothetical protein